MFYNIYKQPDPANMGAGKEKNVLFNYILNYLFISNFILMFAVASEFSNVRVCVVSKKESCVKSLAQINSFTSSIDQ